MRTKLNALVIAMLIAGVSYAQNIVTGHISAFNGGELPGATIVEKGTTNGTISDVEGNFSITLRNTPAVLVFSFVGYATQEIEVNGSFPLRVILEEENFDLTGVEVVGTRNLNRSATESMVPVDYIDIAEVTNKQGQLDMNQLLQYTAPSFNSNRQSGADGADHIDPATLRGLGPDQTLVLINGKRFHQSSLVNIYGTRGRGNTGTDLDAIPVSAIDHIEILRDGASAQYGSDAIAGVINIVLKSNTNEFSGNVNTGANLAQYNSRGGNGDALDGKNLGINGNYGFKIGDNGFVNLSTDYLYRGHTNRAFYLEGPYAENTDVRNQFGDAQTTNFGTWFNSRIPINENTYFYSFGGFNFRTVEAYAFTRSADGERNVTSIYPDGFDPIIASNVIDKSISTGVRGMIHGWNVDLNNTYGSNVLHYYGRNTLNASLETASPTNFDDGGFSLTQNTTSLDFNRFYDGVMKGMNVAFGTEFRIDNYRIFAGDEGSWQTYGPVIFAIDGEDTIYRPGGAQGFPGFRPENEVDAYRTNIAGYLDFEFNFTDAFSADAAVRYEDYSDFGNTFTYKLAARYAISKSFALRGSYNTGFRAPSLPQKYFNSTYTDVVAGVIIDKVISNNESPITRALGIPQLEEEKSQSASIGFTTKPFKGFSATVDGYMVNVQDRIVLTGTFGTDDPAIAALLEGQNVGGATFFTNAVDTKTMGLDVILSYNIYMHENALKFTLAGNFNSMDSADLTVHTVPELAGYEDVYFGDREQKFLLASAPPSKVNFSAEYDMKKFNAIVYVNRFGELQFVDFDGNYYSYSPKMTIDLTLGYDLLENMHLSIGATNLLNTYPDAYDPYETESGGAWDAVQMGFNGTFVFTKLGFTF
ncbi:MAG: TonB-dependent receptor [Chitinophagales bacterium]